MTTADAYSAIVRQVRDVPRERWHEIAARAVAQLIASGQLTQEQAGDVQQMLSLRLTRMLERPTAAARERRREQQRRHRRRLVEGKRAYLIELDGEILNLIVRLGWLDDGATGNDQAVARAVQALLADTARRA